VHRILEHHDVQFSEVNRRKPINVVDLLHCQLSSQDCYIDNYVTEVVKRAWNCISRGQLKDALEIVNRGIVCCVLNEGNYDDMYLTELFHLRLHVAELDPRVLEKVQCMDTLLQVMARCPTYTVLYDILRFIFGDDQSNEKLDNLLIIFRERLQSGRFSYPSDILNEIGKEKAREFNQSDQFQEDWSRLCLAHSGSCKNCKRFNFLRMKPRMRWRLTFMLFTLIT
jgi:hypothetical protein